MGWVSPSITPMYCCMVFEFVILCSFIVTYHHVFSVLCLTQYCGIWATSLSVDLCWPINLQCWAIWTWQYSPCTVRWTDVPSHYNRHCLIHVGFCSAVWTHSWSKCFCSQVELIVSLDYGNWTTVCVCRSTEDMVMWWEIEGDQRRRVPICLQWLVTEHTHAHTHTHTQTYVYWSRLLSL